jgi:hypothetical protein
MEIKMYEFRLIDVDSNLVIQYWFGDHKDRAAIRQSAFFAAYEDSIISGSKAYKIEQKISGYL